MSGWFKSFGTLHHGFGGRFKLGSLAPAEEFDEAVTKGQLSEFDGSISFDFTDTLGFVTSDNLSIGFGAIYLTALNDWVELNLDGDTLVQQISTPNNTLIINGVNDVTASLVGLGLSFPVRAGGTLLNINDGDYAGSVLRIAAAETDQTGIGGSLGRSLSFQGDFVDDLGERNSLESELGIGSGVPYWVISRKINNSGEKVETYTDTTETGIVESNDLSDDTASVHRFENNNSDSILDLLNDNLQSDVLLANDFADDAAAATGDVPVGGLYHNAGALRIRIA